MSVSHDASRPSQLPRIGALGVALAGSLLLTGQALAMQPLATALVSASATAEGKCGEGKCGSSKAASPSKVDAGVAEGQCGEGKCGDASFARTDSNHDGKVSRAEFNAVAGERAAEFDRIDGDHDGFITELEAHEYLRNVYQANGKPMPKGLFSHITD